MPIDFNNLKERYGFACAKCGYEQSAAPSIAMKCFGENSGHGNCLSCKTFLRLEIDESGEKMNSLVYDDFLEQRKKQKESDGFIVDRSSESDDEDPEIVVRFPDNHKVRFWQKGLSDEEYISRAKTIRANERKSEI